MGIASARAGIEGMGMRRRKGDVRNGWRATAGCSNWMIECIGGSRKAMVALDVCDRCRSGSSD